MWPSPWVVVGPAATWRMVQRTAQRTASVLAPASVATTRSPATNRARARSPPRSTRRLSLPSVGKPGARDPRSRQQRRGQARGERSRSLRRRCPHRPGGGSRPRKQHRLSARRRKSDRCSRPARAGLRRTSQSSWVAPRSLPRPSARHASKRHPTTAVDRVQRRRLTGDSRNKEAVTERAPVVERDARREGAGRKLRKATGSAAPVDPDDSWARARVDPL